MKRIILGIGAVAAYAAAIAGANWLTDHLGQVPVGVGEMTVTAGTYCAGIALLARDAVQDTLGRDWVRFGIALGAVLTLAFSPTLALASAAAFLTAESADMFTYTRLRAGGWERAALASGAVGSVVDTVVFLSLAPFPFGWGALAGQLVGKIVWATALPVSVVVIVKQVRRVVPRYAVES
ncbi:VUT family protein [Streptomyces turgidiscabies]|uniref:VUT family protein n=1 Tax=Streptomyces turgidiscabies TaxID=85558 RepID=UPI0038F61CA7